MLTGVDDMGTTQGEVDLTQKGHVVSSTNVMTLSFPHSNTFKAPI